MYLAALLLIFTSFYYDNVESANCTDSLYDTRNCDGQCKTDQLCTWAPLSSCFECTKYCPPSTFDTSECLGKCGESQVCSSITDNLGCYTCKSLMICTGYNYANISCSGQCRGIESCQYSDVFGCYKCYLAPWFLAAVILSPLTAVMLMVCIICFAVPSCLLSSVCKDCRTQFA